MSSAQQKVRPASPRIVVIGADGLLGEAVARDALLRSLEVVSAAEDPSRLARLSPGQLLVEIDPGDPVGLLDALSGASAVILALEPEPTSEPRRHDLADLVTAVVRGMRRTGATRLVASSTLALRGDAADPRTDLGIRRGLRAAARELRGAGELSAHVRDLRRCEMLLDGSGMDWTVLRAERLTDLLGTRAPRLLAPEAAAEGPRARAVPREDLARALVDQALTTGDPAARVRAVAVDA
jgi:uncharacterized protein YbjT (DUF2867 family)